MASLAPWIFDGILLVFLIVCMVRGAKRGMILALCSLLAVFIAFAGASVAAKQLSPKLSETLQPRIQASIEKNLESQYEAAKPEDPSPTGMPQPDETGDENSLSSVLDAIRGLGIYEHVVNSIRSSLDQGFHQAASSVAAAAAMELASSIAYLLTFVLGFVVILLLWYLLCHGLDLVARLPVLHAMNRFGGAVIGLTTGAILLFVIAWALQFFGRLFPEDVVQQTVLLKFFLRTSPLSLLSGF